MSKLDEIRASLKKKKNMQNNFGPSDVFPFWNMSDGSSSTVRFLPDGNDDNSFFWVEKQVIRLTFPGILGDIEKKEVTVVVPCMEMYGKSCPILTEVRPWWSDDSLKDLASKYWKKRSYIFQGFVQETSLHEDEVPENPIRRFIIGPQIFNIIETSLLDPEFEEIPTDYENGTNFIISKTSKGKYADYSTSKWARRETPLTQEQLDAIEQYGLNNLSTFLPPEPTPEHLNAIYEMFQASVDGELYDPERWAKYYAPKGVEFNGMTGTNSDALSSTKTTDEPVDEDDDVVVSGGSDSSPEDNESETTGKSPQEILEMIRNRSRV